MSSAMGKVKRMVHNIQARAFAVTKADPTNTFGPVFSTGNGTMDRDIYTALLRARQASRDLYQNNVYAKSFIRAARRNIVGPTGARLEVNSVDDQGRPDAADNNLIESEWRQFSKKGMFDVSGKYSRATYERSLIEQVGVDGEYLTRMHGPSTTGRADNPWGFALELVEIERLDEQHNVARTAARDTEVVMSVEIDEFKKPMSYWLLDRPPFSVNSAPTSQLRRQVPAKEIIHGYLPFGVHNTRGVGWMHSAIEDLKDQGDYRNSAVKAAKAGANKQGTYAGPDEFPAEKDDQGNPLDVSLPVHFDRLPPGSSLQTYDPTYPHEQFRDFNVSLLQGIAAGLGMSHFGLAQDHANVNFSTGKLGIQDERDEWVTLQNWHTETFLDVIYREWLRSSILVGRLNLPIEKLDKWTRNAVFHSRTWISTQPREDAQASETHVQNFTKSRSEVIRDLNKREPEDVWSEIASETEILIPVMEKLAKVGLITLPRSTTENSAGVTNAES